MIDTLTLHNGIIVPCIGYGTCKHSFSGDFQRVITSAIEAGYRYFDTASYYETERDLGAALKASGIDRKDLTVASKVWYEETGYRETKEAFYRSLNRLGLDYLDLYLIHWPKRHAGDTDWKNNVIDTYRAMEELYQEGLIRGLGLSNFLPHHLDVILKNCRIKPVVDQLELHLGYSQEYAVRYLKEQGILPQAWSPMGRGRDGWKNSPVLTAMAAKYDVSIQKLSLRFLNQKGIMPLPFSTDPAHIQDNLDIFGFEISEEDLSILSCMPQEGWLGEHPDFFPPIAKHINMNQ